MVYRFLGISVLHWLVSFVGLAACIGLIAPRFAPAWMLTGAVWLLAFLLSGVFASWAFSACIPERTETWLLAACWLVTLCTGYAV